MGPAQRTMVEAYAGLYGLELVAVVEDAGVSAKTLDRDGLQRVLDMLRRGGGDWRDLRRACSAGLRCGHELL